MKTGDSERVEIIMKAAPEFRDRQSTAVAKKSLPGPGLNVV